MTIRVEITKEELDKYIEYGAALRYNPCKDCESHCGCRTCLNWRRKSDKLQKSGISGNEWDKSGAVKEYVIAYLDYDDAKRKYEKAEKDLDAARNKECSALEKLTIIKGQKS